MIPSLPSVVGEMSVTHGASARADRAAHEPSQSTLSRPAGEHPLRVVSDDFVIVQEHPSLLKYVDDLQRKNAEALSFYPAQVFEREAEKGRLFLGLLNGEPCGYVYMGAAAVDVKCHQVCIQYDARRRLYGASLVVAMEDYAHRSNASTITLRCGFDLDANDFWQSLGYGVVATQAGGIRRMRTINVWRKELQPGLFQQLFIEPARGKIDATLWAKHKKTGIVTQFARGKAMRDYRAQVVAAAIADTHPKGGDGTKIAAPFMSGGGADRQSPENQHQPSNRLKPS